MASLKGELLLGLLYLQHHSQINSSLEEKRKRICIRLYDFISCSLSRNIIGIYEFIFITFIVKNNSQRFVGNSFQWRKLQQRASGGKSREKLEGEENVLTAVNKK